MYVMNLKALSWHSFSRDRKVQLEPVVSKVKSCKIDDLATLLYFLSPMTAVVEITCGLLGQNYSDMAYPMVLS